MSKTHSDLVSLLPPDWQHELRAADMRPVPLGMGGATLIQIHHPSLGDLFLKIWSGRDLAGFRSEVERTNWLAGRGVKVPAFLRVCEDGAVAAAMMTAVPGRHPGDLLWPAPDTMAALARGLSKLHSLPVLGCPFDETVATRLARARESIGLGLIDPSNFNDQNQGRQPQEILDRLVRSVPASEDMVLVHGDATFDNILIDSEGNIGFIDCGHVGRGDRYLDLQAAVGDIERHFGPEWVDRFALLYNKAKLDPAKLRFFSDLYELF